MAKSKKIVKKKSGIERRKSKRKSVLDSFHVFLVLNSNGSRKFYLKDVSEGGLGFYADQNDTFKVSSTVKGYFYLNSNLRIPLKFKIAHAFLENEKVLIGCEFVDKKTAGYKTFLKFLEFLDHLEEFI